MLRCRGFTPTYFLAKGLTVGMPLGEKRGTGVPGCLLCVVFERRLFSCLRPRTLFDHHVCFSPLTPCPPVPSPSPPPAPLSRPLPRSLPLSFVDASTGRPTDAAGGGTHGGSSARATATTASMDPTCRWWLSTSTAPLPPRSPPERGTSAPCWMTTLSSAGERRRAECCDAL